MCSRLNCGHFLPFREKIIVYSLIPEKNIVNQRRKDVLKQVNEETKELL